MINKIGFGNIRVFKNYQEIELKPITVLTGPNNSGKSTISRVLRLLTEGYHRREVYYRTGDKAKSKKNFYSMSIDELCFPPYLEKEIGNFSNNISKFSGSNELILGLYLKKNVKVLLTYKKFDKKSNSYFEYKKFDKNNREGLLSKLEIFINKNKILKLCDSDIMPEEGIPLQSYDILHETIWKCKLDKIYAENFRAALLLNRTTNKNKQFLFHSTLSQIAISNNFFKQDNFVNKYAENLRGKLRLREINDKKSFIDIYTDFENQLFYKLYKLIFGKLYSFDKELYSFNEELGIIFPIPLNLILNGKEVSKRIKNIDFTNLLEQINNPLTDLIIDEYLNDKETRKGVKEEIPFPGINLDLLRVEIVQFIEDILESLYDYLNKETFLYGQEQKISGYFFKNNEILKGSVYQSFAKKYMDGTIDKRNLGFINNWLEKFDVGKEFIINDIKLKDEIVGCSFAIKKDNKEFKLSENGLGIRKVIGILLKIVEYSDISSEKWDELRNIIKWEPRYSIILEEPESNLHPRLQSLLAEMLAAASYSFNIQFIIETHSEYFIRKFQYLVAKNEVQPRDIKIYYFHNPDHIPKGEKQIKELTIREDGMMDEDFGPGFFDESTRLTIDLLKLQNRN